MPLFALAPPSEPSRCTPYGQLPTLFAQCVGLRPSDGDGHYRLPMATAISDYRRLRPVPMATQAILTCLVSGMLVPVRCVPQRWQRPADPIATKAITGHRRIGRTRHGGLTSCYQTEPIRSDLHRSDPTCFGARVADGQRSGASSHRPIAGDTPVQAATTSPPIVSAGDTVRRASANASARPGSASSS